MAKLKTIDIKGKEYVMVNDRILEAHRLYADKLSIITKILGIDDTYVRVRAVVKVQGDILQTFTGHAEELRDDPTSIVNKTSALENCETSAIGRALASAGIGILEGIASADEMKVAFNKQDKMGKPASDKQKDFLCELYMKLHNKKPDKEYLDNLTGAQASKDINGLLKQQPKAPDYKKNEFEKKVDKDLEDNDYNQDPYDL